MCSSPFLYDGQKGIEMRRLDRGFTLVELAIVLVIVGLLIAGILKGQELIASAQLNRTVVMQKEIVAAFTTFKDLHRGIPGDIVNPTARIPGCTDDCARVGDGDNRLGSWQEVVSPRTLAALPENVAAWSQLAAANLFGSGRMDVTAIEFGNSDPVAPSGGGFLLVYLDDAYPAAMPYVRATAPPDGHYAALTSSASDGIQITTTTLRPAQAQRVDQKADDGRPNTGDTIAIGIALAGQQQCATATTSAAQYALTVGVQTCGLFMRIGN